MPATRREIEPVIASGCHCFQPQNPFYHEESERTQIARANMESIPADRPVVLDLQKVRFLGSDFVGGLIVLGKRLRSTGNILVLCNISGQVQDVLRMVDTDLWVTFPKPADVLTRFPDLSDNP